MTQKKPIALEYAMNIYMYRIIRTKLKHSSISEWSNNVGNLSQVQFF
jgi:hypothetical protein